MNAARSFLTLAVGALALVLAGPPHPPARAQAQAQPAADASFEGYVQVLAARARAEGVSERTIQAVIPGLTYNPRVVALDRSQPGISPTPPPVAGYLRTHVNPQRIARGRDKRSVHAAILPGIEQRYGVPAKMLLAIWGHETNYGSYMGDFDLARSLATLAFDGRRRELFAGEFIAVLKIIDQGVPRARLTGSWAGAFGHPQFLPSVYLRLAVDGDGNGTRDLWTSEVDTLASIANYFRDAGWRAGEPWGVAARIPDSFSRATVETRLKPESCSRVHARHSQWKPVSQWRALGIQPLGPIADDTLATLFEPDGPGTRAWLLTGNYRVILQYNCSNYYALSVGLLADEIAR
ncbi:MAG TPA: lytic murein transglycosylase [Novosphingobium sp.]|nr:lytic murein transglycosylase [Novosphingobium sp.]